MSTARSEILGRIRAALGRQGGSSVSGTKPISRTYRSSGDLPRDAVVTLLCETLSDYGASVRHTGVVGLGDALIAAVGNERPVAIAQSFDAAWLPESISPIVDDGSAPAAALDLLAVAITTCAAAIALTGTLILDGGDGQGRRALSLVPDHHVCIVRPYQVVETVPEAIHLISPRKPLTLISGPSATSDIELSRVEGVHGPRRLDVIILDD